MNQSVYFQLVSTRHSQLQGCRGSGSSVFAVVVGVLGAAGAAGCVAAMRSDLVFRSCN